MKDQKGMTKRRIGFLLVNIYEKYQANIWPGAAQAALELGYDLFLFPGAEPHNEDRTLRQNNVIYSFLKNFPFDGLVIASNSFGTYNTAAVLEEFLRPFRHIPHVCIGTQIGKAPTLKVDQRKGLIDVLEHVITVHNRTSFAYIRGPVNHPEADIRYQTFLETLKSHHIDFDTSLLYTGNFLLEAGVKAVREWKREKKFRFDTVVAASDQMAIGALNTLEENGYSVPRDIAVIGFDDITECRLIKAPLTTVSQPLFSLTYEAVCILDEIINKKAITRSMLLPTTAVIRHSCGCFSSMIDNIGRVGSSPAHDHSPDPVRIANQIAEKFSIDLTRHKEHIQTLIRIIISSTHKESFEMEFIIALNTILIDELNTSFDLNIWNDIFNEFFSELNVYFQKLGPERTSIFMQKIRVFLGEVIERRQAVIKINTIDEYHNLYDTLQHLGKALDKEKIAAIINEVLPKNKIAAFLLILYSKSKTWEDNTLWEFPEHSSLFAGFGNYGNTLFHDSVPLKTIDFIKPEWLKDEEKGTYVVHPIFFENSHMGYMIAKMGPRSGLLYESLRAQISSSLVSSFLFEENKQNERAARKKSDHIQSVILPMLASINTVNDIASAKVRIISELVKQTEKSNSKLHAANESIENISRNVQEMLMVIEVIDDISHRINLLSINASIQSVRAGEYGKGFAIIATEIRKLADLTASNAKKTTETLKKVVETVQQSRDTSEESIASFTSLKQEIILVSQSLKEISEKMNHLALSSNEIVDIMK
ncbi:MAG: substrate-binding domain-containing protein [Spirochaetales bacterium]|nr:substrate-binding domain-containing protein [Spirochaetales bacterium]